MIRIEQRRQRVVQLVMELTGDPDSDVTVTTVLEAFAADGPIAVLPGGEVAPIEQIAWLDGKHFDESVSDDWFYDSLEPHDPNDPEPPVIYESLPDGDRLIDFTPVFRPVAEEGDGDG